MSGESPRNADDGAKIADAAVLILCGGRSTRMGTDKAALPFGDHTLLERIARVARDVVDEVWIVAREGQTIPGLGAVSADLPVARDPEEGMGPLAGIIAGLRAVPTQYAFVTSCDAPLLAPAYIRGMLQLARGHAAAVPLIDGHWMTVSAVYSKTLLPAADRLIAARELRPRLLVREPGVRTVEADELRAFDPELRSLIDCNTPDAYREALKLAGLPEPEEPEQPPSR